MTILHIDSSINGENSASRQLTASIVEQLKGAQWGEEIVYRDLAANPLPHLTFAAFADDVEGNAGFDAISVKIKP